MIYPDSTKEKFDTLVAAASGLQMVSIVSQNTDSELNSLDAYAVELLTTADDEMSAILRQRLHLLRAMREEQAEVLYAGFKSAKNDQQLEMFACDMDDISFARLDRVVHNRILGEPLDLGKILTERLHKVQQMRDSLKPMRDSIFRFLAADSLEDAEAVLLEDAHILLTEDAGQEILQSNSRDRVLRQRIDSRKKLWRKVYGQHSGKLITDTTDTLEQASEKTDVVETAQTPEPIIPNSPSSIIALKATEEASSITAEVEEVTDAEADRLMDEVYDLLDQAIGNAMVAFSIYRKSKSARADEALKILYDLHNELKDN